MRYLIKARVRPGQKDSLLHAIDQQTLGKGSIAGDEYQHDMKEARVDRAGVTTWVETCFCDPPLEEERSYWEEYFELLSVRDAHSRCNCDCTKRLEEKLRGEGESFLARLRAVVR